MISVSSSRIFRMLVDKMLVGVVLLALLTPALFAPLAGVHAQANRRAAREQPAIVEKSDLPALREYRGVRIGMTAAEARQELGEPADKSDAQDYYSFSDQEMAQIFYDEALKVKAVCVNYLGATAPAAQSVLGVAVTPGEGGTIYRLVKYPQAGYWVSYSRTAGDAPVVTVVMQRL